MTPLWVFPAGKSKTDLRRSLLEVKGAVWREWFGGAAAILDGSPPPLPLLPCLPNQWQKCMQCPLHLHMVTKV